MPCGEESGYVRLTLGIIVIYAILYITSMILSEITPEGNIVTLQEFLT